MLPIVGTPRICIHPYSSSIRQNCPFEVGQGTKIFFLSSQFAYRPPGHVPGGLSFLLFDCRKLFRTGTKSKTGDGNETRTLALTQWTSSLMGTSKFEMILFFFIRRCSGYFFCFSSFILWSLESNQAKHKWTEWILFTFELLRKLGRFVESTIFMKIEFVLEFQMRYLL